MDPQIADILRRLTQAEEDRAAAAAAAAAASASRTRPKALHCKNFILGQNWPNFSSHFIQTVKAAHGIDLPAGQAQLDRECLSWLPSKLEPGPTLIAYNNLPDTSKDTWDNLNAALGGVFADEMEREQFLSDVTSFQRRGRSLLEYRNEL